jgi:hypothetical protein
MENPITTERLKPSNQHSEVLQGMNPGREGGIGESGGAKKLVQNEILIKKIRMHWIVQIPPMLIFLCTIGLSVIAIMYHAQIVKVLNLAWYSWMTIVLVLFAIAVAIISNTFLIWFYNYYVVTTHRIIHFWIKNGFHYEAEEIMLDRVKYIDVHRPSLFALILNYGHLELGVDLNTETSIFKLKWIKSPHKIMHELNKVM